VRPLLLALHACGAAEHVIDRGLALGLPFAVVPSGVGHRVIQPPPSTLR
jgi:hypothetical protein